MNADPSPTEPDLTELPISIRAYAVEVQPEQEREKPASKRKPRSPDSSRSEPQPYTLVFDTETTTDPAQRFRLGWYRFYAGDLLDEERLIIDREALTEAELITIADYVAKRRIAAPITLEEFRRDVLIKRGIALGGTIVTFNGPFDYARVSIAAAPARASQWRRKMQGGFSLSISESDYDPSIQIKSLNPRAAIVELTAPRRQETSRSRRKREDRTPPHRGFFVDVKTLAAALLSRSFSLEGLTQALDTPTKKVGSDDHGQALTFAYLDYARSDVAATWECYCALLARYRTYGFSTPVHSIISEASIGKAALDSMGIRPWAQVQPGGIDGRLTSLIMSTYYGGRTEVRRRREMVRVLHTDFTSMYPTVCALQNLWSFVIGQGFTTEDATDEVRALIAKATPEQFQNPSAWPQLTALVRVKPDRDLFPVRADYSNRAGKAAPGSATIALNYLTYDGWLWFTLADCLVAKFLSGKAPVVEEAIAFRPGAPQPGLKPIRMLGRHVIDPYRHDLYRELIKARQLEADETVREALKITANSTSYGIFVQVNVNAAPRGAWVQVFRPDGGSHNKRMKKVETPGPWFNPLVATLITGAARLMLALAEHRAISSGLGWAFCDTDSLAIAQPGGMDDATFRERAAGVVEWFRPLNPYGRDESVLKVEKVNFAEGTDEPRPLYCWAISSKRYALFNLSGDGQLIIRKASAHGLGHLRSPYPDDDAPDCFPPPLHSVLGGKEKLQRWHYDLWCAILTAVVRGKPTGVSFDYHPALRQPTVSRYTATSPEILSWFRPWNEGKAYADQVKPFGFLYLLHQARSPKHPDRVKDRVEGHDSGEDELHPVAPFDTDLGAAVEKAFDRVSNAAIDPADLQTYREVLTGYPNRAEAKFLNARPFDRGVTGRRHVRAVGLDYIGKEADRLGEDYFLGIRSGEQAIAYGGDPDAGAKAFVLLRNAIEAHGKSAVAAATGVARGTLTKLERGEQWITNVPHWWIGRALGRLNAERSATSKRREEETSKLGAIATRLGLRPAARKLGIDPSNLAKRIRPEA